MDSERGVGCHSSHEDKRGDRDRDATRTGNSTRCAGRKCFWHLRLVDSGPRTNRVAHERESGLCPSISRAAPRLSARAEGMRRGVCA